MIETLDKLATKLKEYWVMFLSRYFGNDELYNNNEQLLLLQDHKLNLKF